MTNNGKANRAKRDTEKKTNGSICLVTKERNENDKRNGELEERKEQQKLTKTRGKGKEMGIKMLVVA